MSNISPLKNNDDKSTAQTTEQKDIISQWRERLVTYLLRGGIALGAVGVVVIGIRDIQVKDWAELTIISIIYLLLVALTYLKTPYLVRAYGLVALIFALYMNSLTSSGMRGDSRVYLVALGLLALMLLDTRPGFIIFGLATLIMAGMALGVTTQQIHLPYLFDQLDLGTWVSAGVIAVMMTAVLAIGILTLQTEFYETQQRERAATDVINKERLLLEQRVVERTSNLELAAEVGRSLSRVRALDVTLKDAVELIRSRFDLYYVQVYLTNPAQNLLLLRAGTGTVGAELVGQGHRLTLDTTSVNGRAAVEKHSVVISDTTVNESVSLYLFSHSRRIDKKVISDTSSSKIFRPNPLLPDTRSEMVIPLIVDEKVVGVLDLQNNKVDSLNQDILPGFESLAGQLAVAIQNANLLAEINQARAEIEAQARRQTRTNWLDYMDAIHQPEETGFVFEHNKVTPLTQAQEMQTAENSSALVAPISITGESLGNLIVEMERESPIARTEELINTVARQVAQQIENLRLLDTAERFRYEAEQASRRLTHEGWQEYMDTNASAGLGYLYDLKEVRAYNQADDQQAEESTLNLPLKVHDETIGRLVVQGIESNDEESVNLANAVAERLGAHIEGLRLSKQTEQALATTKKQAQREQALRQITSAVRGSTDPTTILRSAARELGTLLGRKTIVRLATTAEQSSQTHHPADVVKEAIAKDGNESVSPAESPNADGGKE